MGEEKEKEVRVADFRSQRACLSEEGHFLWVAQRPKWGQGKPWRAEGGLCQTLTLSQCLKWKERLTSLSLQLSKYFCFPFAGWSLPLLQPARRAFRAVALSRGVEVSSTTLTRWDQTEDCWAQVRGRC